MAASVKLPQLLVAGLAVGVGAGSCAKESSLAPAIAPADKTITFAASDFAYSGTNPAVSGRERPDALAQVAGTISASSLQVRATTTNAYQGVVSMLLDGQPYRALTVPQGSNNLTFGIANLPAGSHTLAFNIGEQARDNEAGDIFFQSVQLVLPATASWATTPPVRKTTEGIDILGDSNSMGVGTTEPGIKAYPVLLRTRRPTADVVASGYSSFIGWEHMKTASVRADEIAGAQQRLAGYAVKRFVLAVGTNDYFFARCTAADFGTALTAFVQELKAAIPGVLVYVQTAPVRTAGEAANAKGSTMADYRTAARTAAQAAGAKLVEGPQAFRPALITGDGTHYTDAAHQGVAAYYDSIFAK